MPSPLELKGGWVRSRSSRYQPPTTPTARPRPWGQALQLPARRGSVWPTLEPACHLICKFHFQMKHRAAEHTPGSLLVRPQTPSCGSVCSCVREQQRGAGALGISSQTLYPDGVWVQGQAPPFTHPATQPHRWAQRPADWLLRRLVLLLLSTLSEGKPPIRWKSGLLCKCEATVHFLSRSYAKTQRSPGPKWFVRQRW